MVSLSSSVSHASPIPSPSLSAWFVFGTKGQLSTPSSIVSLSSSASHASPIPSPSVSVWLGLTIRRQLSVTSGTPSPSVSILIVQVYDAGDASTFPDASVALTWNVWLPSVKPRYVKGVVHATNPSPSKSHSNVLGVSLEMNSKVASLLPVGSVGLDVIFVSI